MLLGQILLLALIEYPYVSIYHTEPTVTPDEKVAVKCYVTDWNHSLVRNGDGTKRFDVMLEYGPVGGPYTSVTNANLASGDHEFAIGPFPRGDYLWRVWCRDRENGLESHRVLHDVRVRTAAELAITERETRRVTDADLAKYGLVPERDGLYRTVLVDTPDKTTKLCATNIPTDVEIPDDGYVVFAPSENGKLRFHSWKLSHVVHGPKWNPSAVAVAATNNNLALQKLLDDTKSAGYRKLVLPPRKFRIANEPTILVPDRFTFDLGGATLKLNGFTGKKCNMIKLCDVYDSHLVNGTMEGDYYEHDYSVYAEWVNCFSICGDSRYCSVENMTITHITGYGSTVGMEGEKTRPDCKAGIGMMRRCEELAPGRFTGDWVDLTCFSNVDRLCVSHRLDPIRGRVSKSWLSSVDFYDADKRRISGETAFLYRDLLIPQGAKYARVTVECDDMKEARGCDLSLQTFRIPSYNAIRNNRFHLNRSTAHVPFVCREQITERNDFGYCGEACTHCAVDTEDGWEGLHDFYFRGNVFHDTQNADVIANSGLNCVFENNVGTLTVRARCNSPCVRGNICTRANFLCGADTKGAYYPGHEKSMYGRYENNVFKGPLKFGDVACSDGWSIALSGSAAGEPDNPLHIRQGASGDFRAIAFTNCVFHGAVHFSGCTFSNCTFAK